MSEPKDLESLLARVTERRRELLTSVVNRRTRHFCMVLEDLFDPHNISAVIRTAEVFGLQDVHVIEEDNAYSVNKSILKGSYKWMSIYLYKKRMLCMEKLRARGYKIAVASTKSVLKAVAAKTGGRFYRAENKEELEKIYSEIDELEKTEIETIAYARYAEKFYPWLLVGALLILLELLLANTRFVRIP